jgi:single-strand DNA-binding protein
MQRITIIGNVGQDATIKQAQGAEFITFSVAVNEKFTNREGIAVEQTQWYNCLYQPRATTVAGYLKKGTRVFVEGKPKVSLYKDREGNTQIDFGVQVRGIELLSSVVSENIPAASPKPTPDLSSQPVLTATAETGADVLPF